MSEWRVMHFRNQPLNPSAQANNKTDTYPVRQSQLLKTSPNAAVRSIKKTKLNYGGKYISEKPKGPRTPYLDSSSLSKRDGSIGSERETRSRGLFNRQMPISIPYTTPASEFLYGTSVVESALKSHRIPRRKMYKLYIYYGEQRQDPARDSRIERLAQERGIEVLRVDNDHIRIMDKMSAGRPHNGFVLEASPLPKLPVKSLGLLTTREGANGDKEDGFEISLDFQSREEASINGRSNFVKISRNPTGRKPLVLLLDGIVDPGNLGGLIRTASFLGVSAVAISTRNTAPLTPVVLKASAGAIENMTLLSVHTQDDFITASKEAGWKVYAAVAPAEKSNRAMPASLSSDDLIAEDPLTYAPVILMLGSEGEGLRWSIRRKADADIYIDGFGQNSRLDSLNVNVAAGILCNSLLATRGNLNRVSADVTGRSNSAVKKTEERDQKTTAEAPVTHYKDQEHIF